jgi:hypothetical protein
MPTIIAGSRTIDDKKLIFNKIKSAPFEITEVVSGKAEGVDTIGEEWAKENNIPIKEFPYTDYLDEAPKPNIAPLIRNEKMAEYADKLILIWDGSSNGSENMKEKAKAKELKIYEHRTDCSLEEWL